MYSNMREEEEKEMRLRISTKDHVKPEITRNIPQHNELLKEQLEKCALY